MNHSPNSLGDIIRIENSNLDDIGVIEIDGNHYVTESSIQAFMQYNGIESKSQLMESLTDFNHINVISILDESTTDETLVFARDVMMLYEDIHPFGVANAANGTMVLKTCMSQMLGIISRGGYDSEADVVRYIKKCDDMLEDIQEEKKNARERNAKTGQVKFSCMFIFNIAKTVFFTFVFPLAIAKKIQWPNAIKKLFISNGKKAAGGFMTKQVGKYSMKTIATAAAIGVDAAVSLPPDLKGLYLSIADYEKLLDQYERDIRNTRSALISQQRQIVRQKEMNRK